MEHKNEADYSRPNKTFLYYEKYCPLLHSLEYPLDLIQAYSLEQQYGYDICRDYLAQLNNYRGAKKYLSVFSTLETWIRKDLRNDTKLIEAHNRYLDSKKPKPKQDPAKVGNAFKNVITCDMYEAAKGEFLEAHPKGSIINIQGLGKCEVAGGLVDIPNADPMILIDFIQKYYPGYIHKQVIK